MIPSANKGIGLAADSTTGAAIGGGVGAAGGALVTLLQKQPSLRKALKNALMGAAGGAVIGGGAMALKQIKDDKPKEADKPAAPKPAPKQMDQRVAALVGGLLPLGTGAAAHGYLEGGGEQAARSGGRSALEQLASAAAINNAAKAMGKPGLGALLGSVGAIAGGAHGAYAAAGNFNKRETEKSAATTEDVDRLLKNDGIGAHIEDALMLPGSRRRAGRAAGMADSLGNDAGSSVTHPRTTRALAAILGAGIGGVAGHHLDKAQGDPANGTLKGTYAGAAGGASIASILTGLVRRHETKRVGEETKKDLAAGEKPTPNIGKGSLLGAIRSAEHEQGRADTAETIATGRRRFEGNPGLTLLEALGIPLGLPANVVNAADARSRLDRANPMPVRLA